MTRILSIAAFIVGGAIVTWVAAGFLNANRLAFAVTAVIGVVYIIGFIEMLRFQRDTTALKRALASIDGKVEALNEWLGLLPLGLHSSVRLRIQGEHVPLPAPMLTPYLVGLLVMLGLLGTFAGMVDTLKGAVSALEGTTELEAIRAGLTAPIKGLSLAFGTSVAGVSASAMLGFISSVSRRQRSLISQSLDSQINNAFQDFSLAYNRQQTFKAMQDQAQALPLVAEKLTTVAERLEHFSGDISQQLTLNQEQFHSEIRDRYESLASSVDTSLKQSLTDSSHLLGDKLQQSVGELNPLITDMTDSVSRDLASTQTRLVDNLEQQFSKLSQELANTTKTAAEAWQQGFSDYQQSSENMVERVANSQTGLADKVEQQLSQLSQELASTTKTAAETWQRGVSDYQHSSEDMVERIGATLDNLNKRHNETTNDMLTGFTQSSEQWLADQHAQDQQRLTQWHEAFTQTTATVQQSMGDMLVSHQGASEHTTEDMRRLLNSTEQLVERRAENENQWLTSYETRMAQLTAQTSEQLAAMREEEARRGTVAIEQLNTLSGKVAEHLLSLGTGLEAPMSRLIETASETPRAAAEVISQLRAEMSNTIERDNQLLEERQAIFEQLSNVANALQQSSTQQSDSLQQLVSVSADTLNDIGTRFSEQVDGEATRLSAAADHFSGSAVELASLGDAFGAAVEQFGQSNRDVGDMLRLIEGALQSSTQRSDEQMAYYVAQAREIIDHTILSQQEAIEHLRQLGRSTSTTKKG